MKRFLYTYNTHTVSAVHDKILIQESLDWSHWPMDKIGYLCGWVFHVMYQVVRVWIIIFNTLRPRQSGRHFADDNFKCIFLNENAWISLKIMKITLKFVPKVRTNNIPALVQIMAWRRPGDKPLSEPMMISLLTHICVTRPQWVKGPVHSNRNYYKSTRYVLNWIVLGKDITSHKNIFAFSIICQQSDGAGYWNPSLRIPYGRPFQWPIVTVNTHGR